MVMSTTEFGVPYLLKNTDKNNQAYLELTSNDRKAVRLPFTKMKTSNLRSIARHLVEYSYRNWAFAAKIFLNIELFPFQSAIIEQLWKKQFPLWIGSRGAGKSFLLSVYALLRGIFDQGSKVLFISASYRQSRHMFAYLETIYRGSPILQQICKSASKTKNDIGPKKDIHECRLRVGDSIIKSLPLGDGQKIRGERATHILCDEFASVNEEVFQVVVRGFGAVSLSPVEKVKKQYRLEELKRLGVSADKIKDLDKEQGNQVVISGTASYKFVHFYAWYQKYLEIIASGGDKGKIRKIMSGDVSEEDVSKLDYKQFCVIRTPYGILPKGLLDDTMIAQAKATMSVAHFGMEYNAEFFGDSDGFYPRSIIESVSSIDPYPCLLYGNPKKQYIIGVDPARKQDHFSIVVVEIGHPNKVVYCWATNIKKMKKEGKILNSSKNTYYGACARKIRDLTKRFNVVRLCIDEGGGGSAIKDFLQDVRFADPENGDYQIWEVDNREEAHYKGLHILEMISQSGDWNSKANHNMKRMLETRTLLMPYFDTVAISRNHNDYAEMIRRKSEKGKAPNGEVETGNDDSFFEELLEDISLDAEEMKNEISNISVTATPTGKEHFGLPKNGLQGQKVTDNRRKDRYSACLLAAWGVVQHVGIQAIKEQYDFCGGSAASIVSRGLSEQESLNKDPYVGSSSKIVYVAGLYQGIKRQ